MSNIYRPSDKAVVKIQTTEYQYEFEADKLEIHAGVGGGYGIEAWSWAMTVTNIGEKMNCVNPELTLDDLYTIGKALAYLEDIAEIQGMHAVEIRMKTEDPTYWTVLGYGEAGDPCVIRFEKDA